LNFRELFEIKHQRERDGIERTVRLAAAREIDMRNPIGKGKFAIAIEAIEYERESLVAFDSARTFEVFIEDSADQILGGGDKTLRGNLIWKLPGDQAVVICVVDIDLYKLRCAGRQRCERGGGSETRRKRGRDRRRVGLGRCA
jgi:hypothetical protein